MKKSSRIIALAATLASQALWVAGPALTLAAPTAPRPQPIEQRQLLLEYERQQELYALSLRFTQLAARQNVNLKDAKKLVRAAGNKRIDTYDENQKINLSVQKDEQAAIRDEAMGVINRLGVL